MSKQMEKKLNRRVITLVYLISRLFYIWFLAINLEPADLVNQACFSYRIILNLFIAKLKQKYDHFNLLLGLRFQHSSM